MFSIGMSELFSHSRKVPAPFSASCLCHHSRFDASHKCFVMPILKSIHSLTDIDMHSVCTIVLYEMGSIFLILC